jgi:TetR/AcrR family transcriptional regulator, cholesterol catabolism regulator
VSPLELGSENRPSAEPETKDRLLEIAIDLFATEGYAGTSIRDIAKAMGMSISNIYHYYGSKEGILLAIFEQSADRLYDNLRRVAELDIDPLTRFSLLMRTNLTLSGCFRNEARIYTIEREQFPPEAQERTRAVQRQILKIYVDQLRALEEQELLAPGDLGVLAFNVLGVINWPLRWFREGGALSFEQVGDEIVRFVLRGCLKPEVLAGHPELLEVTRA